MDVDVGIKLCCAGRRGAERGAGSVGGAEVLCIVLRTQDYMVLMPEAYYAATILQQRIYQPCTVPPTANMYVIFIKLLAEGVDLVGGTADLISSHMDWPLAS